MKSTPKQKPSRRSRPQIDDWEIADLFGVTVVRGLVDGKLVTARLLWWANDRFGIARDGSATEEVLKIGARRRVGRVEEA